MKSPLKPGDCAYLKGQKFKITVVSHPLPGEVECWWFTVDGDLMKEIFPEEILKPASEVE